MVAAVASCQPEAAVPLSSSSLLLRLEAELEVLALE